MQVLPSARTGSLSAGPFALNRSGPGRAAFWLGALVAVIGALILVGWWGNYPLLKSLLPRQVEAKANSGFCLMLAGTALLLKIRARNQIGRADERLAALFSATCALIGLLTLLEYGLGLDFGLDHWLAREPLATLAVAHPGRMAMPRALNFFLTGLAIFGLDKRAARSFVCLTLIVPSLEAVFAFLGYLYDVPGLTSLGVFTSTAIPTAMAFMLLCTGVWLAWLRDFVAPRDWRLGGFAGAMVLLLVLAGGIFGLSRRLLGNTYWVSQTHETIAELNEALSDLQEAETGVRGYLLTGNREFLAVNPAAASATRDNYAELRRLLANDPRQIERLVRVERLAGEQKILISKMLELVGGAQNTAELIRVSALEEEKLMDAIRAEMAAIRDTEDVLLIERSRSEETSTWQVMVSLGVGLVGSCGILIFIFQMLRAEIRGRRASERALKESEENLRVTLHSIGDGVLATDTAGRVSGMNPVAEQLTGWREADARGRPITEVFRLIRENGEPSVLPVAKVLATGETDCLEDNTSLVAKDGVTRAVADSAAPIRDSTGKIRGMVLVFRDVTVERAAEAQIRALNHTLSDRARQLETANRELETFSYSVSHDLTSPLFHVQCYIELLAKELTNPNEKAGRYLKVIADASRKMGQLITDLLAFSKMSRTALQSTSVDLNRLAMEVIQSLETKIQGRNIDWILPPLPSVQGDPAMLSQVLANLLENAVKYSRHRDPAEIELRIAGEEKGRVIFFVRDNGAGFDMKYADKLFGVFSRLHRQDEFEGTGIGLANVHRIIERHGGRIWAEAKVDAGATFFFTLQPAERSGPRQMALEPEPVEAIGV